MWHELRHFISPTPIFLRHEGDPVQPTYRFGTGELLEVATDEESSLRRFIVNSGHMAEGFDGHGDHESISWSDGAGASVRGVGFERLIIAYHLANLHDDNLQNWPSWKSPCQRDITSILSFLSQASQRRYEKMAPHLTIAYYPEDADRNVSFGVLGKNLLDEYKALLRMFRDAHTIVVVNRGCVITDIRDNHRFDPGEVRITDTPVPPRLAHLQQLTAKDRASPVLFNLNPNGSVEILAKGQLMFRRVNRVWRFLRLEGATRHVSKTVTKADQGSQLVAHNFLTLALDLADRGEGALLFLCDEPTDDVLNSIFLPGHGLIRELPGLPYQELTVRARFGQLVASRNLSLGVAPYHAMTPLLGDLCSIDGATAFSFSGELLGFGCLVRLSTEQSTTELRQLEGARTAAAEHVSRCGVAIKVSSDGDAALYINGCHWGMLC